MIKRTLLVLATVTGIAGAYVAGFAEDRPRPETREAGREAEELMRILEGSRNRTHRRPAIEEERLRVKIELDQLRARHEELIDAGRLEQAERVQRRVDELEATLRHHDLAARREPHDVRRREMEARLEVIEHEIDELHDRGKHEEAEHLEREARELERLLEAGERRGPHRHEEIEELERRIHHLRVAADNLHAAGLHEQAEDLIHQAEELEEGLEGLIGEREEELEQRVEELEELVHDLRREVEKLRDAVHELQERVHELSEQRP